MRKALSLFLVLCLCAGLISCTAPHESESSEGLATESETPETSFDDTVSEEASDETPETSREELPGSAVGIPTVKYPNYQYAYSYTTLNTAQKRVFELYLSFFEQFSEMKPGEEKVIPVDWDISEQDWYFARRVFEAEFPDVYDCFKYTQAVTFDSVDTLAGATKIDIEYVDSTENVYLRRTEAFEEQYAKYLRLTETADGILASLEHNGTEYGKARAIAYWIVDNVKYNTGTDSDNSYGALVEGRCVCAGYAKAFSFLYGKAGLMSILVHGPTSGMYHAWNKICVDGEWYNVDTTWMVSEDHTLPCFMMPDSLFFGNDAGRYGEMSYATGQYYLDKTVYLVLPKATSTKYMEYYFIGDTAEQALEYFENTEINREKTYTVIIENGNERQRFIKLSGKEITDKCGKKYIMTVTPSKNERVFVRFVTALSW